MSHSARMQTLYLRFSDAITVITITAVAIKLPNLRNFFIRFKHEVFYL